ncbi:MAG: gliding motility lipoprotein GldB [Bacteroidota bacterium]
MLRVPLIISSVLIISCSGKNCRESVDPIPVQIEVQRIDQKLFHTQSTQEVENLLDNHADFAKLFLDADQYPSNIILADQLFDLLQNPSIDTLYQESQQAFADLNQIIVTIESSLGRLSVYYPETKIPILQTAVTGLYKDLFISNEHVIIGMDFFVGKNATYKPQQIPNYILKRYNTEHLPANIMQFISSQYIQQCKGETMLSDMIDHGKSYYLLSQILPCTPENVLIGYTEEEWNDSFANDAIIWANFIENKLLYDTDHQIKQKFLGERPNVYEIGVKCPGRIGRWLGWQIVKRYAEKTDLSIQKIMAETDANKIFHLSEYKPSGS